MKQKRKIFFPITSRAYSSRMRNILELLNKNPNVDLQLIGAGAFLIDRYSEKALADLENNGLEIREKILSTIEGGNHTAMAKTAGLTILETSNLLQKLNPDLVVICGDRFEQLAIATAAAYLNKTIAHIEGGDVSGSIDESVRHAVTKLSHLHLVTNEDALNRVLQMGENPKYVFNVGSPDVEYAANVSKKLSADTVNGRGVGGAINIQKPFLTVIQHPVTSENNGENIKETLKAVSTLNMPAVFLLPNNDAGTEEMSHRIREYREKIESEGKLQARFITDLFPDDFIALLKTTACLVGNSSAGIKEGSYLGTPVVNIGTRQNKRLCGPNVLNTDYDSKQIVGAVKKQLKHGKYKSSDVYFKPNTAKTISEMLTKLPLYYQKEFYVHNA